MQRSPFIVSLIASAAWASASHAATCDFGDLVECPRQCAAGDLESCYFHARALSSGNRIASDKPRAVATFRELCEKGHADSCNALAHNILGRAVDDWHSDEQFLRAQPLFERGCTLGSSKACNNMGSFLRRESLGRTGESLGFWLRSCELGKAQATTGCNAAATSMRDGTFGVPVDRKRAAELFKRGCLLGATEQCAQATALGAPASLSATDLAAINRDACRRGDLKACSDHGYALWAGRGLGRDLREAARILEIVCGGDVNVAYGCSELASLRLSGELPGGVDIKGSVEPARKACDGGSAEACRVLGDLTVMGQGLPADRRNAARLYEKACALKAPIGCQQAGALRTLDAGAADKVVAQSLFADGCLARDDDSCRALERAELAPKLKEMGAATALADDAYQCESRGDEHACFQSALRLEKTGDRVSARRLFDIACQGGVARACTATAAYAMRGWGGPKSEDVSLEALARACVLGHAESCMPAKARITSTKRPERFSPAALARARKALQDGCRAGVGGACFANDG